MAAQHMLSPGINGTEHITSMKKVKTDILTKNQGEKTLVFMNVIDKQSAVSVAR